MTCRDASETVLETSVHHERSPSPEEKQFVDDDGTMYVWNAELQKFQPQVDPTSALQAEYGEEAMTYQADDEEQPRLENFVRLPLCSDKCSSIHLTSWLVAKMAPPHLS